MSLQLITKDQTKKNKNKKLLSMSIFELSRDEQKQVGLYRYSNICIEALGYININMCSLYGELPQAFVRIDNYDKETGNFSSCHIRFINPHQLNDDQRRAVGISENVDEINWYGGAEDAWELIISHDNQLEIVANN